MTGSSLGHASIVEVAVRTCTENLSTDKTEKLHAMVNFLFPKHGEWRLYVSPGGYQMVKIVRRKG